MIEQTIFGSVNIQFIFINQPNNTGISQMCIAGTLQMHLDLQIEDRVHDK